MTELLVFKWGDSYLRIRDGAVSLTSLFKATVYPKEPGTGQEAELAKHKKLVQAAFPGARLRLLRLEEHDYLEEGES
jgi:hypothetical protein